MARLAAPSEIHDEPTARISAARLEQEIARSRMARGSAELDALVSHPGEAAAIEIEALLPEDFHAESLAADPDVMVRTFAGRHPWLVLSLVLAAAVLVAWILAGAAGP